MCKYSPGGWGLRAMGPLGIAYSGIHGRFDVKIKANHDLKVEITQEEE